jgi:transposase
MSKFTEELQEKIISLIEEDTFSVTEICNHLQISRKSFYEWKDTRPEFREAMQKAKEQRDDKLLMTARRSLKRKLEGYTLTEIRTTYVPDKDDPDKLVIKSQVVREREYAPDTHAIKVVLTRNDAKYSEEEGREAPWNIVVRNQETADGLEQLRENLRKGSPLNETVKGEEAGEEARQETEKEEPRPLPEKEETPEPVPEPEKAESPDDEGFVRRYDLPPGYLYQKVKRSELRKGEVFTDEETVKKAKWEEPKPRGRRFFFDYL